MPKNLRNELPNLARSNGRIVEKLVQKLESRSSQSELTLDQVVDEFERENPELLDLLAQ